MKVAILQSNYIPWKGYFDLIATVDEFIIFDDVQFTKNDWRNRNQIKTPQGKQWLTVPVGQKINRRIRDVEIQNSRWQAKHWRALENNYRRAPCFKIISEVIEPLYMQNRYTHLSVLNKQLIVTICEFLGIKTLIRNSWDYRLIEGRCERLVELCVQANATSYYSGYTAKSYLDEYKFLEKSIEVVWFDYEGYPEYPQLWGCFEHNVSILDLLFNCGAESPLYMKHVIKC